MLLTDLFPTRVRFSGVALGFNVAFTIFSGTAPLVATSLIRSTGLETAPAFIMVASGLLTLVGSLGLPRDGYVLKDPSGPFDFNFDIALSHSVGRTLTDHTLAGGCGRNAACCPCRL